MAKRTQKRRTRTMAEAAEVLGISIGCAYDAAKRGEIPTVKVGRLLLIPADGLDRLLSGDWPAGRKVSC
jgi:excisionase family DNA binding protein